MMKTNRLETQEELIFQFKSKGRNKTNAPFQRLSGTNNSLTEDRVSFLFYLGF
jgi:hypothetical protein